MVLIGEQRRTLKAARGVTSAFGLVAVAILLLVLADGAPAGADAAAVRVYRLGNWPALFGIVLVLDRLSALMLVLIGVLGLAALVFSLARWHRVGTHFHPLFQFQRSEEHTSELQSLMRISYAVFCLKKKKNNK